MPITKNLGMLCLALFLILFGVSAFVPGLAVGTLSSLLALIAGILILVGK